MEGRLDILRRYAEVEIGKVAACPCIAAAPGALEFGIEIFDIGRAAEHQVFEQVGHAGTAPLLVARTDVVEYIHAHHGRGRVGRVHDAQTVGQGVAIDCQGVVAH